MVLTGRLSWDIPAAVTREASGGVLDYFSADVRLWPCLKQFRVLLSVGILDHSFRSAAVLGTQGPESG